MLTMISSPMAPLVATLCAKMMMMSHQPRRIRLHLRRNLLPSLTNIHKIQASAAKLVYI